MGKQDTFEKDWGPFSDSIEQRNGGEILDNEVNSCARLGWW